MYVAGLAQSDRQSHEALALPINAANAKWADNQYPVTLLLSLLC